MSEKEKALVLTGIIVKHYADAQKKLNTFTKANELLVRVKTEFGKEYATRLYQCFLFALYINPKLTEDGLIEKVLNDIKKKDNEN